MKGGQNTFMAKLHHPSATAVVSGGNHLRTLPGFGRWDLWDISSDQMRSRWDIPSAAMRYPNEIEWDSMGLDETSANL